MTTLIARTAVQVVTPIVFVTSAALLLQGHNLPGGGFIAGVLTATAFALLYTVYGLEELGRLLGLDRGSEFGHGPLVWYHLTLVAGLALAAGAGLVPMALGAPFLTQGFVVLTGVPIYGEFELASAIAFDLGVYLTVVGALLSIVGVVGTE